MFRMSIRLLDFGVDMIVWAKLSPRGGRRCSTFAIQLRQEIVGTARPEDHHAPNCANVPELVLGKCLIIGGIVTPISLAKLVDVILVIGTVFSREGIWD